MELDRSAWFARGLGVLGALALVACSLEGGSRSRHDDDDGDSGRGGSASIGAGGPASTGPGSSQPTLCDYPVGPYGVDQGQIVPPTLAWTGYRPGQAAIATLTMAELHDCDGTKGIHAILFATSQFGCAPCYEESSAFESHMTHWGPMGIVASVLLLDDEYGGPPTLASALAWKQEFSLVSVGVFIDPTFSLVPGDSVGTPMQSVIDPRTMKVVKRLEGLPSSFPELEGLATKNGGLF